MRNFSVSPNIIIDDDEEHNVGAIVLAVMILVMCFIGLIGNAVSVIIFSKRSMRSSINILLAGLSLIDFFVLIFAVPVFGLPSFAEAIPNQILNDFYPNIVLILYPLSMVSQTSSIWTFVVINVERYLAICRPFGVRKYFTSFRTKTILIVIVVMSVVYNLIRFWEFRYDVEYGVEQLLRKNRAYYHVYYTTLYLVTHFAGPFFMMLVLNILMFRGITKARKMRETLTKRALMQQKTTHMCVVVTVMFGLCNTLPFVLNVWEAFEPGRFWNNADKPTMVMTDVSNCLVILNSSTTFIIYLLYCKKYRILFLALFRLNNVDVADDPILTDNASRRQSRVISIRSYGDMFGDRRYSRDICSSSLKCPEKYDDNDVLDVMSVYDRVSIAKSRRASSNFND